jgi:hypothetical protein
MTVFRSSLNLPIFAAWQNEVSFTPQSDQGAIAPLGDSTIQVAGIFTLHGTPGALTVPMQLHIDGLNLAAKANFAVAHVQRGLKGHSVPILKVAREVGIDVTPAGTEWASKENDPASNV